MSKSQIIGYIRVSTFEQNPERQLDGVAVDRAFIDKASSKTTQRPQLTEMLNFVREGDTVVVHSMDRLARNLNDLRQLAQKLTSKGVKLQFIKEQLTFTGQDSPISTLLLSMLGACAEFEVALIRERQLEGIALAKQRGVYKGRKAALNPATLEIIKQRLASGEKKAAIARDLGINRGTLYQYLHHL